MADWERGTTATRPPGSSPDQKNQNQDTHPSMTAGEAVEGARAAGRAATEQVKAVAAEAGQSLRDTAHELKDAAIHQVEDRKEDLADRVKGFAETVRHSADEMRDRESWLAEIMDRGSDELVRFAETVRTRDLGQIANQVEDFARRQPALFAGATFALGFALARFAKASASHHRYSQSYSADYGRQGYGGSGARQSYGGAQGYGSGQSHGASQNQGASRQDYRPQDYRPQSETSFTTSQAGSGSTHDPNRTPPKGTELGAHVAGPELDETPYRERTGTSTPGAGGSTTGAGGRVG